MRYALNATTARALGAVAALAIAMPACRRDAAAPLDQQHMFPDAGVTAMAPPLSAAGTLARAELVQEREPNDRPDEAQAVSSNALIEGTLAVTEPTGQKPAKGKKGKTRGDADWYRLAATPPGQLVQIDLREGPPCAQIELYDDAGKTLIARARSKGGVRPVLPSIGQDARASLVRVTCDGEGGGPYKLAAFTRVARPDEELEPNGTLKQTSQSLVAGQSLQGTLAPEVDVDVFALDFNAAAGTDVWVLSVTPVPGVVMELSLLEPGASEPLLVRKSQKDGGIVIPDLAPSRLPKRTLLQLKALSGQAPDQPYVLTLAPLLPAGCGKQAECLDRLPSEREPNETRLTAQQVQVGQGANGFLDGTQDVDALEIVSAPGAVLELKVTPPAEMTLQVQVGDGADTLQFESAKPGEPVTVPALRSSTGRMGVLLRRRGDAGRPSEPWLLHTGDVTAQFQDLEVEAGDERKLLSLLAPVHSLVPAPPAAQTGWRGGWTRTGALLPAGDVDAFGLDLRSRTEPSGLKLTGVDDGQPGLTCTLLDARGHEVAHTALQNPLTVSPLPLSLPPGLYTVVIAANKPRQSLGLYRVSLEDAPEYAQLPAAVTPVEALRP